MKPKTIVWIVIGVIAVAALVWGLTQTGGGVENVDAAGVEAAMKQPGVQVIDVRTAGEYQMGHIPGAVNVPVDQLEASAASWDRDATYVVYCATGARSTTAVETMKAMGFANIKHFDAGIQAWSGQLDKGGDTAASSAGTVETNGKPVLVEFYTDS